MIRRGARVLALTTVAACGGSGAPTTPATSDALDPRRYYPLEAGTVWSYDLRTDGAERAFATVRVLDVTPDGARVQRNQQEPDVVVASAEGVRRRGSEGWILRAPLEIGATYLAEGGRSARIDALDASVRTGMGELVACIRVVEVAHDTGVEVTTVFCPDVGPAFVGSAVVSDVTGERAEIRATLIGVTRAGEIR